MDATAAAIGGVDVPIGAGEVVAGGIAERFRGAIDGCGRAFEFQIDASGCFIEVQLQAAMDEGGAEFFVGECGMQTEGQQDSWPCGRSADGQLALETFFIARAASAPPFGRLRGRRLEGEYGAAIAGADRVACGGRFSTNAEETARAAKVSRGRVEERVALEDASKSDGADALEAREKLGDAANEQLDFDFDSERVNRRWHPPVYSVN